MSPVATPALNERTGLERWAPGLAALLRYDPAWLPKDVAAGLSVAAIAPAGRDRLRGAHRRAGRDRHLRRDLPAGALCTVRLLAPADPRPRRRHLHHGRGEPRPAGARRPRAVPRAPAGADPDHGRALRRGRARPPRLLGELPLAADPDRLPQRDRHRHHRRPAAQAAGLSERGGRGAATAARVRSATGPVPLADGAARAGPAGGPARLAPRRSQRPGRAGGRRGRHRRGGDIRPPGDRSEGDRPGAGRTADANLDLVRSRDLPQPARARLPASC